MQAIQSTAWGHALRGETDPSAPVSAQGDIVIERPDGEVWAVLADVANWPAIRSDIHDVVAEEGPASGSVFSWFAGEVAVQSRFAIVEPGRRLTWMTEAPGLEAVHVYDFEAIGSRMTRLTAVESMDGAIVAAAGIGDAELGARIASWLAGIKALVEGA